MTPDHVITRCLFNVIGDRSVQLSRTNFSMWILDSTGDVLNGTYDELPV